MSSQEQTTGVDTVAFMRGAIVDHSRFDSCPVEELCTHVKAIRDTFTDAEEFQTAAKAVHDYLRKQNTSAIARIRQRDSKSAGLILDKAIAIADALASQKPGIDGFDENLTALFTNRGCVYLDLTDAERALADFDKAISLREAMKAALAPEKWTADAQIELANDYINRGMAQMNLGKISEANADFDRAVELNEALRAAMTANGTWNAELHRNCASAYVTRARAKSLQNDLDASIKDLTTAIDMLESTKKEWGSFGIWVLPYYTTLAKIYQNRAGIHFDLQEYDDAFKSFGQCIETFSEFKLMMEENKRWTPELHEEYAETFFNRAMAHMERKQLIEALEDLTRAGALRDGLRKELDPRKMWNPALRTNFARTVATRANVSHMLGKAEDAVTDLNLAIKIYESLKEPFERQNLWNMKHMDTLVRLYTNRSLAFSLAGKNEEAVKDADYVISEWDKAVQASNILVDDGPEKLLRLSYAHFNRGILLAQLERFAPAAEDFEASAKIKELILSDAKFTRFRQPGIAYDYAMELTHLANVTFKACGDLKVLEILEKAQEQFRVLGNAFQKSPEHFERCREQVIRCDEMMKEMKRLSK